MGDTDKMAEREKLGIVYGDATLGIYGSNGGKKFHYIFSYVTGGPESLVINDMEWLYRSPRPCFWRATTDNDRGNGFSVKSAVWTASDLFISSSAVSVEVDGKEISLPIAPENNRYSGGEEAEKIRITYIFETNTMPSTQVRVSYEVEETGKIRVQVHYYGKKELPQLPAFGLRFVMPTCAGKFVYEGLSGETYPDRKAGAIRGIYEVEGLPVTPYLVPQECGMHMDTDWVEIYRNTALDNRKKERTEQKIRFQADREQFAFSCLPYTALELENATHMEELPPARRTVLCIYGAVRGVGGIDSWRTDVGSDYQIDAGRDIVFSFSISMI